MGVNYGTYATPRADLAQAWMEYVLGAAGSSEFIATEVLPVLGVPLRDGKFSAITRDKLLTAADTKRANRAGYNRVDFEGEDKSWACEEFGLEGAVDDRERIFYASDFDHEMVTTMQIIRKLKHAQEARVSALIFNTTTWTGSDLYTDVSGSAPWDTASSAIIANVIAAKEKVRKNTGGREANCLIVTRSQFENLLKNTEIKAQFPGAPLITKAMLESALGSIFGLERLIVAGGIYNSAAEKATSTYTAAEIWSDDYAMIARVAPQGAALNEPCIGRTFLWTGDSPSELVVETYREEQIRGDVVRVRHDVDEVVLGAEFGHLLKID